jgi:SAM-dependent methyltransferase
LPASRFDVVPWKFSAVFATTLGLLAAGRAFTPYASVKPILDEQGDRLPVELRNADEARWLAWSRREDKAIRGRLQQGDLDSLVNFLLLGASFTRQPRIRMEGLAEASKAGVLRGRVDDLVAGMRTPGDNERLIFLQGLLRSQGVDPETSDGRETGAFVYNNLLRVVQQRKTLAQRAANAAGVVPPSLFRDRGLSLDTDIFPDFAIEQTLRDLKKREVLRAAQVSRVAVIGPGLDFIDKNEDAAYDYYPQQTLQPFALYDSLVRLGLAKANALALSIFDISPRVIEHIHRARERARKNIGYVIQLPRNVERPWPAELVAYWRSLGDQVGTAIAPIRPPELFRGVETRAVGIRPDVVRAAEPIDLNIVLERLDLAAADRFDLIVGTNVFVYYDAFEQALALENAGAMLKPGGLLLTNDRLPELHSGSMRLAGFTLVSPNAPGVNSHEGVGWYRKQ